MDTETEEDEKLEPKRGEKRQTQGESCLLSRASLFKTRTDDAYQRVLRLSPWKGTGSPRVGAVASGMAQSGELIFFDASSSKPREADVIGRVNLGAGEEADDVDFTVLGDENENEDDNKNKDTGVFRVAYTNGVEVLTCEVSSKTRSDSSPKVSCVYTTAPPSDKAKKTKPRVRSLRFISSSTLLLLQNAPDRGGCELLLLQSQPDSTSGTIIRRRKLPRSMQIGLGLDVCNLPNSPNPDPKTNRDRQTIIAVSGHNHSIEILTLNHNENRNVYSKLTPYKTLLDVHPFPMTKLCFSTFIPPTYPISKHTPPQSVKLASVSMGNTVAVHTFPLSPFPPVDFYPRYVLDVPERSDWGNLFWSVLLAIVVAIVGCLVMLLLADWRGVEGVLPWDVGGFEGFGLGLGLGLPWLTRWLSGRSVDEIEDIDHSSAGPVPTIQVHQEQVQTQQLQEPQQFQEPQHPQDQSQQQHSQEQPQRQSISSLLKHLEDTITTRSSQEDNKNGNENHLPAVITVRHDDTGLDVSIQQPPVSSNGFLFRSWRDLIPEERSVWMDRLVNAGYWAVEEGERVLEGVFFGEFNGVVGRIAQGGLY